MFKVNKISISRSTVNYQYTYDNDISKYFNKSESFYVNYYDQDISKINESILVIPLLSNILTIAWFVGFDIYVDEIDMVFYNSLDNLKLEFEKSYPSIREKKVKIFYNKLIENNVEANKSAMLFSGGVDAYATYFRNVHLNLDLITILGADVRIEDKKQWNTVVSLNENERLLNKNSKFYIESNLRTFYTYKVDLLLNDLGWWGKVQHGLALNGILAPLSIINGYSTIYIASSYTDNIEIAWGSTPQIDNAIQWAKTKINHDGYELKRQQKVEQIVSFVSKIQGNLNLRVCYSELNNGINCSKCEKCYRTILGIILSKGNPLDFGFEVNSSVYDSVLNKFASGFGSKGAQYFWWEINEKIKQNKDFHVFQNKFLEQNKLLNVSQLIDSNIKKGPIKTSGLLRIKHKIQNKFPVLLKYYLKIRHSN